MSISLFASRRSPTDLPHMDEEEALSPREAKLARAARRLRLGAAVYAAFVGLIAMAGLIGALAASSGIFRLLKGLLLFGYAGAADTALGIVILLSLLNVSLLLVAAVGVLAREIWALPALALVTFLNALALLVTGFTPALIGIGFVSAAFSVVRSDLAAFRINPVMLKELRGRMRGARAFLVLTAYLSLMSGFALLIYLVFKTTSAAANSAAAGEVGRVLFMGVVGIELLLIIFIAPAFTAGAITGEREHQTFDLLRTTLLSSPTFVIGKLESSLGYIFLLLLAGIPLQSIAFLFGGVGETELLIAFEILMVTAVALGAVGIYFSAAMARTLAASVRAYAVILACMFIVPIIIAIALDVLRAVLIRGIFASPAIEAVIVYLSLILTAINPVTTALSTQQLLIERQTLGFWSYTLTSDGSLIPMVSPWILYTILYLTAAALLIVFAIRRTRRGEI